MKSGPQGWGDASVQPGAVDFRALFTSAPGLYLVLTPDLRIVAASHAYLQATMTSLDDLAGLGIFEAFPDNPSDPDATGVRNLRSSLYRVLQDKIPDAMPIQQYDVRLPESEGGFERRYWSPLNTPVLDEKGEVRYIIHRVEDVTAIVALQETGRERAEAAQQLEVRAERLQNEIFLRAQQVSEVNAQLRSANEDLTNLYGRIAAMLAHTNPDVIVAGGTREQLSADEPIGPAQIMERIANLITRHLEMGERLQQAQKMEAVGRLAGGVAHDFNNLLTVIRGNVEFLSQRVMEKEGRQELSEIDGAAERAAALTSKLLAFSRKQIVQVRVVDLNSTVSGMEGILRRLIGEDIQLSTVLDGNVGRVKADANQIEQVVLNLAVNARDAMPRGGKLTIETKEMVVRGGEVGSLPPGTYATLTVTDSGHGMDEYTAQRVFEPFFTTKENGQGTGLGLATAYAIAEQGGGTLTVQTAPGRGAAFRMYLPATAETADAASSGATNYRRPGTGCILVAEDEAPLRNLIVRTLRSGGYDVIEAGSGDEALAKLRQTAKPIALVLTDVIMPGMGAMETVKQIAELRPGTPVLFMSGYDRNQIDPSALSGRAGFLAKPFSPNALLQKIAEQLRGARAQRAMSLGDMSSQ